MKVTLRQLRTFVVVGTLGSFTLAAGELHLTQPAVSRHISELERILGQQLLVRTGRQVSLTDRGADLMGRLTHILDELDSVLDDVRRSEIRIAFSGFLPDHWTSALIPDWEQETGVQIDLARRDDLMTALDDGECDAIIYPHAIPDPDYLSHPVWSDRLIAAVPATSEFAGVPYVTCAQITGSALTGGRIGSHTIPRQRTASTTTTPRPPLSTNIRESLELVAIGRGVALIPDAYRHRIEHRNIRYLPVLDAAPIVNHLVMPASRARPELVDFCRRALSLADRTPPRNGANGIDANGASAATDDYDEKLPADKV